MSNMEEVNLTSSLKASNGDAGVAHGRTSPPRKDEGADPSRNRPNGGASTETIGGSSPPAKSALNVGSAGDICSNRGTPPSSSRRRRLAATFSPPAMNNGRSHAPNSPSVRGGSHSLTIPMGVKPQMYLHSPKAKELSHKDPLISEGGSSPTLQKGFSERYSHVAPMIPSEPQQSGSTADSESEDSNAYDLDLEDRLTDLQVTWNEQLSRVEHALHSKIDSLDIPGLTNCIRADLESYREEVYQTTIDMRRSNQTLIEAKALEEFSKIKKMISKRVKTQLDTVLQECTQQVSTDCCNRCDQNAEHLQVNYIAPVRDSVSELKLQVHEINAVTSSQSQELRAGIDSAMSQLSNQVNTQIKSLQSCVDSLSSDIAQINSRVNSLNDQLHVMGERQDELQGRIDRLESTQTVCSQNCNSDALAKRIHGVENGLATIVEKMDHLSLTVKTAGAVSRHTSAHPPGSTSAHTPVSVHEPHVSLSRSKRDHQTFSQRLKPDWSNTSADSFLRGRPHPYAQGRGDVYGVGSIDPPLPVYEYDHSPTVVPNQYVQERYSPIASAAPSRTCVTPPEGNLRARDPAFSPSAINIDPFDGRLGAWGNWFHKFSSLALSCQWTDQEKLVKLTAALKGNALTTHRNLPLHITADYSELVKALENRYAKTDSATMSVLRANLANISQRVDEDLDAFGDRVYALTLESHPNTYTSAQLHQVAVEHFIRGCRDLDAARLVFATQEPTNITEAVTLMRKAQASSSRFRRSTPRMVTFDDPPEVKRLSHSGNGGHCFLCQSPNHWVKNCPERLCDNCDRSHCDGYCDREPSRGRRRRAHNDYCSDCEDQCAGDCELQRRRDSSPFRRRSKWNGRRNRRSPERQRSSRQVSSESDYAREPSPNNRGASPDRGRLRHYNEDRQSPPVGDRRLSPNRRSPSPPSQSPQASLNS